MPISPTERRRPWMPERNKKEQQHQGRKERTSDYDTDRWRKIRKLHLQAHPLCVECLKEGKTTEAKVLDHIKRVNDGGSFWDSDNHQGLCFKHHAKKSAQERHGK